MATLVSNVAICTGGTRQASKELSQKYSRPSDKTTDLGKPYVNKIVAQYNAGK